MKALFTSKRFWLTLAAIATAIGTAYGGETTWIQSLQTIIGAIAAYVVSLGVRDAQVK